MILLPGLGVVICLLIAMRGLVLVRDQGPIARLTAVDELAEAEVLPRSGPASKLVDAVAARYGPLIAGITNRRRRERMRRTIDLAGRPGGMTMERYARTKTAWALGGFAIGILGLLVGNPLLLPGVLLFAWLWPDLRLISEARRRQTRIDRDLPDFLDILAVTVGAGAPFRAAVARVNEGVGGPVGEEMTLALRQIDFGSTSREALEGVRSRTESAAMEEFVTAVLQAEELGAPLAATLVEQASDLRRSEHQRARQRAQKAAPRVSLVTTTLLVPATVVLIVVAIFLSADADFGTLLG